MKIYQRKKSWYLDYFFGGVRIRKSFGNSKEAAERALAELQEHKVVIEIPLVKPDESAQADPSGMVFEKLCDEYLASKQGSKTPQSFRRDQVSIHMLLKVFRGKPINTITPFDVNQYQNMRRRQVEPATVNRDVACLKHMFNLAVDWDFLKVNRLLRVKKYKEPPGRVRYLTKEEEERLINCCKPHLKPIVITAFNTGMRRGEILNLKWSDIDFANLSITIIKTKNNEIRRVPINQTLYDELQRLPKSESGYVFCDANGRPYGDIKNSFNRAVKDAGLKDFVFHSIRHSAASWLVMKGVDIRSVQELLGHKDIKMTMRYSHLSNTHLLEAIRKLDLKTQKDSDQVNKGAKSDDQNNQKIAQ